MSRIVLRLFLVILRIVGAVLDLLIKAYCYGSAIFIKFLFFGVVLALITNQTSMVPLLVILLIIFLAVGLFASTVVAIVNGISDKLKKRIS